MTVQQFVHSSRASSIPAEVPSVPLRRGVRLAERARAIVVTDPLRTAASVFRAQPFDNQPT